MKTNTFKRGVHPRDGKELAMECSIIKVNPSGEMSYPLNQHIGAPAESIVSVGDRVLKGQMIAKAGGFVSANIFSAVSGTVKAIKPIATLSVPEVNSIIIEDDGQYETVEGYGEDCDYTRLSSKEILDKVQYAGIVGLGGAGFPAHVKLTVKEPSSINYIIVNGAECEPYLTSDYRVMLEKGNELIKGIKVILKLFPAAKCCIGIENNKPKAIESLQKLTINEDRIEVCPLKTKYPQGGERMLIKAITGKSINSSMLPLNAGCIVENISTVVAIYNAVCKNIPLIERVMTITGNAVNSPCNVAVPIGMSHSKVVDAAGGFKDCPEKIISGGPMMGNAMYTLDVPIVKTSGAVLAMSMDEVSSKPTTACIRCGSCLKACPGHLVPQLLMIAADNNKFNEFEKLGGMECMECGSCTYVCPAKRPLTQSIKYAKRKVAAERKKSK